MTNYYEILGVQKTASYAELKSAYRNLAVAYHPDKNPGSIQAEEIFKRINEAYQIVSDPAKRSRYDATLEYQQYFAEQQRQAAYKQYDFSQTYYNPGKNNARANASTTASVDRDWKKSWLNLSNKNFYIVLFLASVFVFGVIGTANYVQAERDKEAALRLLQREQVVVNTKHIVEEALANNDFVTALQTLEQMEQDNVDAFTVTYLYEDVYAQAVEVAEQSSRSQDFSNAVIVLENLLQYGKSSYENAYTVFLLGEAYYGIGDYDKVITYLENYNDAYHPEIPTLVAKVYREKKKDMQNAMAWHNKAKQWLGRVYQNAGFDFVPTDAPEAHFDAYYESAKTYFLLNNFEQALIDTRGALFLRSTNKDALYLKALCESKLNNSNACASLLKAEKFGYLVNKYDKSTICK